MIVRNRKIVLKPNHTYTNKKHNVPAQIGVSDKKIQWIKCKSHIFRIKPHDYIILCSDGVTDNLSYNEIIRYPFAKLLCHNAKQANKKRDDISAVCIQV